MKRLILLFVVVLFCTISAFAQSPMQDTIPQLKEWWRADNMQYAKYGMTWLDNFYNGKGALVVWTPQGVKTWLLRFPGDTMNVFTWEKGSSNIKTGDFNGDGATDYIDENGYIYEGIKNGEPPKAAISGQGFNPSLVSDINGDGYDDMLASGAVIFGKSNLKELQTQPLALSGIDSNNAPIGSYMVSPEEMRIICGHRYWTNHTTFPFKRVYKDGLRLVRAWWDGSGLKSEVLDEFTVDTDDGTGLYWVSALLRQPEGKNYFVCATQIKGKVENSNVAVYDLSNDKLDKRYSTRMDRVAGQGINSFRYGIDTLNIPSLCIRQYNSNDQPVLHIYNGNISNSLQEIAQYTITANTNLPVTGFISLPDISGDEKSDIALSNRLRLSILTSITPNSIVEEQKDNFPFVIKIISPMPVSRNKDVEIKVTAPQTGSYTLSLYDAVGKKLIDKLHVYQLTGEQVLPLHLGDYQVSSGVYTLQLSGNGSVAHCSIIIE